MKSLMTVLRSLRWAMIGGGLLGWGTFPVRADVTEAADKAYTMAMKYSGKGFYMTPSKEGHAGLGMTIEFEVPVNRGLDYVFIVGGDRFCEGIEVWIEAEETGNTLVKDTRKARNGMAGVRWRSDYNGSVNVVVNFARVTSRCGWCALVGRRGTAAEPYDGTGTTSAGSPLKLDGKTAETDAPK